MKESTATSTNGRTKNPGRFLVRHWKLSTATTVLCIVVVWLLVRMLPATAGDMRSAACYVDGNSKLCILTDSDTIVVASSPVHQQGVWINKHWWWPSCDGRVLTIQQGTAYTDSGAWLCADSLPHLIAVETDSLGSLVQRKITERKELQYYLRCHGVQDEGYQRIAEYAGKQSAETDSLAAIYKKLKEYIPQKKMRLVRVGFFEVSWYDQDGNLQRVGCKPTVMQVGQLGEPVIIHTLRHTKPWGTYAVRHVPWPETAHKHVIAVRLSPTDSLVERHALLVNGTYTRQHRHDIPRLLAADGSPVFTFHGRFIGVVSKKEVKH